MKTIPQTVEHWFQLRTIGLPESFVARLQRYPNPGVVPRVHDLHLQQNQGFSPRCMAFCASSIAAYFGYSLPVDELHHITHRILNVPGVDLNRQGASIGGLGTAIEQLSGGALAAVPVGDHLFRAWLYEVGPFVLPIQWTHGLDRPAPATKSTLGIAKPNQAPMAAYHALAAFGIDPTGARESSGFLFFRRETRREAVFAKNPLVGPIGDGRGQATGIMPPKKWASPGQAIPLDDLRRHMRGVPGLGIIPVSRLS
jgi:hypothetical protein